MKKLILAIAIFLTLGISASAAEVIGSILSTDIGTLIDGAPCKTYNVDGRTFVIAEDLRGYGFDVVYDDSIRRLTITQNPYSERTILSKEEINIEKKSITVGQWLGDMFATDITVYLGDEQIEGYAIDGQMVIPVRALEKFAYVEYSDSHKLVRVNGLPHYLTARYESGNPNVTYESSEKEVRTYYEHWKNGTQEIEIPGVSHSEYTISKESTATDCENGIITAYWGTPYIEFGNAVYRQAGTFRTEKYSIRDTKENLLYDISISLFLSEPSYLRNGAKILQVKNYHLNLYGLEAEEEKEYYCYWPSEAELAPKNVNFIEFTSNGKLLTDKGYLCKINDDGTLDVIRYNIADMLTMISKDYYISLDNKVYQPTTETYSNEINSIFDKCIAENVKKIILCTGDNTQLTLKTDGIIYAGKSQQVPITTNIKDFSAASISNYLHIAIAAINDNNDLYIAGFTDVGNIIDNDVKSAYVYDDRLGGKVYYVKNNGELYSYSLKTWSGEKIADNIRKIVNSTLFITTNDELTDLTNIIATNVKDATDTHILTNDNTIIDRTTGEQIFPKP